jgi:hypothetical protein
MQWLDYDAELLEIHLYLYIKGWIVQPPPVEDGRSGLEREQINTNAYACENCLFVDLFDPHAERMKNQMQKQTECVWLSSL